MTILRIAIVASNYELSKKAMLKIAEVDYSTIKIKLNKSIEMDDNTIYYVFPTHNHVRGCCIDQLIIVDDFRWKVYSQQEELIDWIKYRMKNSCVPEEFQVQEYEYDSLRN